MRLRRVLLPALLLAALSTAQAAPDVFVAYPEQGYRVAHDHVILEGSVTPGASLTIDGRAVNVGPDGLFMEWWPLRSGTNDLRLVAQKGSQKGSLTLRVIHTVPKTYAATPTAIDRATVSPRVAYEFWNAAGDTPAERSVQVSFNGSPGGRASFKLGGGAAQPMRESPAGTYTATYVLPPSARVQNAAFTVMLTGRDGKTVTAVAPGRLTSTQSGPRLGMQKAGSVQGQGLNEATGVATDLQGEPLLYPRNGMNFTLVGKQGADVRTRLAPGVPALITASQLQISAGAVKLAAGGAIRVEGIAAAQSAPSTKPAVQTPVTPLPSAPVEAALTVTEEVPQAVNPYDIPATVVDPASTPSAALPAEAPPVNSPSPVSPPVAPQPAPQTPITPAPTVAPVTPVPAVRPSGDLRLRIPLGGARLPFTIRQEDAGQRLTVTLYGKLAAPLSFAGSADPLLDRVDIRPLAIGVTGVHLHLNQSQAWGFTANYEGDDLIVTVRRPPTLNPLRPLAGRVITLDPGHGGTQKGGAGSLRIPEKNLVLPIAVRAAEILRGLGANVVLTRTTDVTLGLYERGLKAEATGADLLVSIHANALPDGRDPRGIRGPEVYYTHPQAEAVAGAILGQLRTRLPELGPGDGLKPDAFLALTRPSTQISLLVELAYLTDPGNLRALHSPAAKEKFAQAIANGILDFYTSQKP